jgi:hypothetical protein
MGDAMEGRDIFLSMAEVAVAFAGFSSIVVLFQSQGTEGWMFSTRYSYHAMLRNSLAAAFFAGLPMGLHHLDLSPSVLWATSSGVLACFLILPSRQFQKFTRGGGLAELKMPWLAVIIIGGGHFLCLALQLANALAIGLSRNLGPYLVGVMWLTVNSGFLFYHLVTLPLPERLSE